jgi:hypothetical protein
MTKASELPPLPPMEPVGPNEFGHSDEALTAYARLCVDAALEAAAKACDEQRPDAKHLDTIDHVRTIVCKDCAAAIRAMKQQTPPATPKGDER